MHFPPAAVPGTCEIGPHASRVRLVVLSVCDSGNIGEFGSQLGSVAQTLHRAGVEAVIASRFPLSIRASERLTEVLYRGLVVDLWGLERSFLAARRAVAGSAGRLDWASGGGARYL